jgi:hypothetical protein
MLFLKRSSDVFDAEREKIVSVELNNGCAGKAEVMAKTPITMTVLRA